MKPGVACADISAAHDAAMAALGLPPERRVYSHGQGYDMVERPLIRRDEPAALRAGTCLAVHPQFETPTCFAVISDNYIVGPDGPGECLNRTEKEIFEVA
jgi:Xaa-Pro aminopeptidase